MCGPKIDLCHGQKSRFFGDGHPTFNRNPNNGYINPYYWVDDHPLLYGNNGSLDPSTFGFSGGKRSLISRYKRVVKRPEHHQLRSATGGKGRRNRLSFLGQARFFFQVVNLLFVLGRVSILVIFCLRLLSKKSPTGPTVHGPLSLSSYCNGSSNLLGGPLVRSHSIFDGS